MENKQDEKKIGSFIIKLLRENQRQSMKIIRLMGELAILESRNRVLRGLKRGK